MSTAFDLDSFAPDDITFTSRGGHEYRVCGDPDTDLVAKMLRLEEQLRAAETTTDTVAATQAGKKLIVELILDRDPDQDVSLLKLGTADVLTVFALIMHGGSVASAVALALSQPSLTVGDGDSPVTTPERGPELGEDGEPAAPLASASPSSEPSSPSGEPVAGLLATGSV